MEFCSAKLYFFIRLPERVRKDTPKKLMTLSVISVILLSNLKTKVNLKTQMKILNQNFKKFDEFII